MAVATLVSGLAACGTTEDAGESASSGESITLTDSRGKEVTLDGPAVRVAGTEWNVVEYLISLGIQPVGVSDVEGFSAWDTAVELDESATDIGTRGEPSLDTLATLDLDALFVTDELVGDAMEQIEESVPVIVVAGGDSEDPIGQMFENLDLVAEATSTEDEAQDLRGRFDSAVEDTRAAIEGSELADAPVAFSDAYADGSNVSVRPFLPGSLVGGVLEELGLENAWEEVGIEGDPVYGLGQTDVEGLTELPDDVRFWYIANDVAPDPYTDTLADNAVWTSLPFSDEAVRLPDVWMFGGPLSMIQLLEAVADESA